ncbi:DNA glycosylase AlkZ-like family protein [Streptococcus suis]
MNHDTWKGIILQKQGLLAPQSAQQISQNLNGLQAQFQPYVHIGFRNRMTDFQPLSREKAVLEIARRYFSGFGPVSLADARYYFKENKSRVLSWMKELDLKTIQVAGEERYYPGELEEAEVPDCLFIARFDQLLLGYEKKANPFFDPKYIRNIYTLTGIVKPVVFYKGRFAATWRRENGKIILDIFENLTVKEQAALEEYRRDYENRIAKL